MAEEDITKELEKGEKLTEAGTIAKIIAKTNPRYDALRGRGEIKEGERVVSPFTVWQNGIVYDSSSQTLEPLYFWILDWLGTAGAKVEKLVDNFTASPGSGYFADLSARATRMQEEGMKIMASVNTVIKSIINIIYDLKEFEIRLKHYENAKSKKKEEREAGILGLKAIWMDNVDMKRGRGSINAMTYELQFTTLRDAFMKAESVKDVDKMDLNDRVKRVLRPRIAEFLEWWKRSEAELTKRYEIERSYLKSQVSSLKLYTRWARPYLRAAEQLRMKASRSAALVTAFDTMLLELAILAKKEIDPVAEAYDKNLPLRFASMRWKRKYYACVFIDFTFRGIPAALKGHYVFGGRADISFKAYALNEDELEEIERRLSEEDVGYALKLVEGVTTESLAEMQKDIEYFLKKEREEKKKEEINPFTALFSFKKKEKPEEKKELIAGAKTKETKIKRDSHTESVLRTYAEKQAAELCFKVFHIFKKAHDMGSYPEPDFDLHFLKKSWEIKKK